jgi:hypothetical protein
MKKSHREIQELHAREEAQWVLLVQQGPKRWQTFNKVGFPVLGILMILIGGAGLPITIERIASGHGNEAVGHDARGLANYPAYSVAQNLALLVGGAVAIWTGFRRVRRKKGDSGDTSSP